MVLTVLANQHQPNAGFSVPMTGQRDGATIGEVAEDRVAQKLLVEAAEIPVSGEGGNGWRNDRASWHYQGIENEGGGIHGGDERAALLDERQIVSGGLGEASFDALTHARIVEVSFGGQQALVPMEALCGSQSALSRQRHQLG